MSVYVVDVYINQKRTIVTSILKNASANEAVQMKLNKDTVDTFQLLG